MDSHSPVSLALPQEKEMEKQRLLYQQARLHNRGAAEMVLQMISACKGALLMQPVLLRAHPVFTLPNPPISCGPSGMLSHPCVPVVCMHTLALACSTCLAIAHSSFSHNHPCPLLHSFSHIPRDGCVLVGGECCSQMEQTFDHLPLQERRAPWCPPP